MAAESKFEIPYWWTKVIPLTTIDDVRIKRNWRIFLKEGLVGLAFLLIMALGLAGFSLAALFVGDIGRAIGLAAFMVVFLFLSRTAFKQANRYSHLKVYKYQGRNLNIRCKGYSPTHPDLVDACHTLMEAVNRSTGKES